MGIPPIYISNEVNKVKHYLKLQMSQIPEDRLVSFMQGELKNTQHSEVHRSIRTVFKFLKWKSGQYPDSVNSTDKEMITSSKLEDFFNLSTDTCKYTKATINRYTEHLWKKSIQNELQMEGYSAIPEPKCLPLQINASANRKVEVATMSLLYPNNLLNNSLHRIDAEKFQSPLCHCGSEVQSAHHILFRCALVDDTDKAQAYSLLEKIVGEDEAREDSHVTLLNASRCREFMSKVSDIIEQQIEHLHTSVEL